MNMIMRRPFLWLLAIASASSQEQTCAPLAPDATLQTFCASCLACSAYCPSCQALEWPSEPPPSPPPSPPPQPWQTTKCLGTLTTRGFGANGSSHHLIRNMGAGPDSPCCGHHPVAAAARISDATHGALQLRMEGAGDGADANGRTSRRSARVYFAEHCVADAPFNPQAYSAVNYLGKTLAFTVDLSAAACGCNAALYLVNMRQSTAPGWCYGPGPHGGDYYCDANSNWVCGNACAEVRLSAPCAVASLLVHCSVSPYLLAPMWSISLPPGSHVVCLLVTWLPSVWSARCMHDPSTTRRTDRYNGGEYACLAHGPAWRVRRLRLWTRPRRR